MVRGRRAEGGLFGAIRLVEGLVLLDYVLLLLLHDFVNADTLLLRGEVVLARVAPVRCLCPLVNALRLHDVGF